MNRARWLAAGGLASLLLAIPAGAAVPVGAAPGAAELSPLASDLTLIQEPGGNNGARLSRGGASLAFYGDPRPEPPPAELVLFTHHLRDVAWCGEELVRRGARAVVPAGERERFASAAAFWSDFVEKRFHDYAQESTRVLERSLPVSRAVHEGETVSWRGVEIRVLDTPGPTRASVSYVLQSEGRRIAFTGDLVQAGGRILDLYGHQDAIEEVGLRGYHGWAARLADHVKSLAKLRALAPDLIVPARGALVRRPKRDLERLERRLRAVYASYLRTDALRWYFGDEHIARKAERALGAGATVRWLERAELREKLPPWLEAIHNSRLITSRDRHGFVVDCGSDAILGEILARRDDGRLHGVDGVFVTHYHDDHVDRVARLVEEFHCPVYAAGVLEEILEHPGRFRMPALSDRPIREVTVREDGSTMRWKEFRFTFRDLPGQTLYHGGLLVEHPSGERVFFAGDSFTPTGVDDYCLQNRNFLAPGSGFLYCLDLLDNLEGSPWLVNQHVAPLFRFTSAQVEFLRSRLRERIELLRELFVWDDPNYGLDERWCRLMPYAQRVAPGTEARISLRVRNHSPIPHRVEARLRFPESWTGPRGRWEFEVEPHREAGPSATLAIPAAAPPGLHLLTVDLRYAGRDLRRWSEAMVIVAPERGGR